MNKEGETAPPVDNFLMVTRQPMTVDVTKLIYEKVEKTNLNGAYTKIIARVFQATFAKGHFPIYIISPYSWNIHVGNDQQIYLESASETNIDFIFDKVNTKDDAEQYLILYEMAKTHKVLFSKDATNTAKILDDLKEKHLNDPIFFTPTLPIDKYELLKLDDLDSIIHQALNANMNKDEKIIDIFRALIPVPINDTSFINPRQVMQSAPHIILITSTKTSKTSTSRKIGVVLERPTPSNLLGFSTAQDKKIGRLHGETRPFIIDGIEETEDERMAMGMLNYMESGTVEIARGKGVKTTGYSSLIFLSNPSVETDYHPDNDYFGSDDRKNLMQLDRLLQTLHQNQLGFGSRIPVFIFDPDMKPATGDGYGYLKEESLDKILYSIQEATRYSFSKVLLQQEVDHWINQVDDTIREYWQQLDTLLNDGDIRSYHLIYDFINGHKNSFRHLKGMAIRMSYMDNIQQLLKIQEGEEISKALIQTVITGANNNLKKIIGYNLESFSNLSCLLKKEDARKIIYQGRYDNIESRGTKYEIFLLESITRWYIEQPETDKTISVPLPQLKDYYLLISKEERDKSDYNTFNKFASAIENNQRKINGHKTWTGLTLNNVDNIILVTFTENKEWFKWIAEKKDLYTSSTHPQTPQITHDKKNGMGEMGEKGVGDKSLYNKNGDETEPDLKCIIDVMKTKAKKKWNYTEITKTLAYDNPEYILGRLREVTTNPDNSTTIRRVDEQGEYYILDMGRDQ